MIGGSSGGRGKVQGWGTIETGGPVVNNGKVVADGFDHLRDLDLTNMGPVQNSLSYVRTAQTGGTCSVAGG
jgi:hypothetical protein